MANAIVLRPILGLKSDSSYTVTIVTNNTTAIYARRHHQQA
jgi:hypothetical protein